MSDPQNSEAAFRQEISDKLEGLGASSACPFCGNTSWHVLDDPTLEAAVPVYLKSKTLEAAPQVRAPQLTSIPLYVLSCTRCAFVRLHSKALLDATKKIPPNEGGS